MKTQSLESQPIFCDLTAIPASDRNQHMITVTQLFQAVQEVRRLSGGYAFRLPNEDDMFMTLARFVENERRCCPFFGFGLEIEPNGESLWLRLTGSEEARELLETLVGDLPEAVRRQLIRTGPEDYLDEAISARAFRVVTDAFKQRGISPLVDDTSGDEVMIACDPP